MYFVTIIGQLWKLIGRNKPRFLNKKFKNSQYLNDHWKFIKNHDGKMVYIENNKTNKFLQASNKDGG